MEYFDINEKVEGQKCDIYTRRPDCKGMAMNPHTHTRAWLCELSQNASVEVTEEPRYTEREIADRAGMAIHAGVGDKLRAERITVYICCRKKPAFDVREGMSATHGGNITSVSDRTFGVIKQPFRHIQSKFLQYNQPKEIEE